VHWPSALHCGIRFLEAQNQQTIVESIIHLSLRTPGPTRWNATFDAVKRLLDIRVRDKLNCIMDALKLTRLTKHEIEVLDEYVQIMSPIATALDKLQGEEDCFLGNLTPTIHQVHKHLLRVSSCVNHTKQLAAGLSDAVKSRFRHLFSFTCDSESTVYAAAAVCHPKLKLRWLAEDKRQCMKDCFM